MFYNCNSLIELDLSNFNIEKKNEIEIENIFGNCNSLEYKINEDYLFNKI